MSEEIFKQGQSVRARGVFRDIDGELMDPDSVVCKVQKPDGTETAYTYGVDDVIRDSEGVYLFWIATDAGGDWTARWVGDDDEDAANEAVFYVEPSRFVTP